MSKERVYTTIDKTAWGEGPWQDEPDKIQWKDEASGFACLVKRNHHGAWCGYVGLPPQHPFYEKGYSEVYELSPKWGEDGYLDIHGGLTYSNHCAEGPEESSICHVPDPGEPDDVWWLGFDCAHSGDLVPRMVADNRRRALEAIETTGSSWPWGELPGEPPDRYRDVTYARGEVTSLAAQLARSAGPTVEERKAGA